MFLNNDKSIEECGVDEFKLIPLKFFLKYVEPITLLEIWGKLPISYRTDEELQMCLPCFVHYNKPSMRTHIDGPPPSQTKCRLCIRALDIKF